jgi:hypothetical protein
MVAGRSSHFLPDRRISASKVPKKMPPSVAITVRDTEIQPFSTKLLNRSHEKNDQSRLRFISVASTAGCNQAGHANASR